MEKAPYFPFYVNDFSADAKVEAMATIEVGAYILLLCKAWMETPPGTLPNNDRLLSRWARLPDDRWLEHKQYILAPFTLENDGRYHQKRMEKEHLKMLEIIEARKKAGKQGAKSRWQTHGKGNGKRMILPMAKHSNSDSYSDSLLPPNPQGGDLGGVPDWSPSPTMLRLGALFNRKPTTRWDKKEIKALKELGKVDESDLAILERYYTERIPKAEDFRRHDLQTLLNNFNGEVDRARKFKPHKPF
jgi:uncharacterized protein YdaU (DUF1376 family)